VRNGVLSTDGDERGRETREVLKCRQTNSSSDLKWPWIQKTTRLRRGGEGSLAKSRQEESEGAGSQKGGVLPVGGLGGGCRLRTDRPRYVTSESCGGQDHLLTVTMAPENLKHGNDTDSGKEKGVRRERVGRQYAQKVKASQTLLWGAKDKFQELLGSTHLTLKKPPTKRWAASDLY